MLVQSSDAVGISDEDLRAALMVKNKILIAR